MFILLLIILDRVLFSGLLISVLCFLMFRLFSMGRLKMFRFGLIWLSDGVVRIDIFILLCVMVLLILWLLNNWVELNILVINLLFECFFSMLINWFISVVCRWVGFVLIEIISLFVVSVGIVVVVINVVVVVNLCRFVIIFLEFIIFFFECGMCIMVLL